MLSIQAVRGLPRLRAPGIVPCIISFSGQLPCFLAVYGRDIDERRLDTEVHGAGRREALSTHRVDIPLLRDDGDLALTTSARHGGNSYAQYLQ